MIKCLNKYYQKIDFMKMMQSIYNKQDKKLFVN